MNCERCEDGFYFDAEYGEMQGYKFCPDCGEPLSEPVPLTLEQLREMDGQPVWCGDKCYIVNTDYKSPQGWKDACGLDLWGNGTSLSILARCGCYDRPPKEQTPC